MSLRDELAKELWEIKRKAIRLALGIPSSTWKQLDTRDPLLKERYLEQADTLISKLRLTQLPESDACAACGKALVVPQYLDFVEKDGHKFCMGCEGE